MLAIEEESRSELRCHRGPGYPSSTKFAGRDKRSAADLRTFGAQQPLCLFFAGVALLGAAPEPYSNNDGAQTYDTHDQPGGDVFVLTEPLL